MNETWALNLIKNTFENSFDRERFLIFAKNLFHFLDTDSFIYRGNLIPDAYDTHIKTLERLGKYEDVDGHKIEVLAVCLNKQSSLERARTLQRNFIAWYLNGSRGRVIKDAALVAFYTKDSDDWRLSLVRMDYHLGESKAGKIKAITELTPARRFSFLVGANENTHTAQRQLLPILKDTDFKPTLSDLESAFSVEVVTKDFFEKYKKLFLDTKEALDTTVVKDAKIKADFQDKNIETADFAKKLLGQIVFLYFLQKKGWFGVEKNKDWGTGSKQFLRELFETKHCSYKNFFNDILEPLFYQALRNDRSFDDHYFSQFNCKIPFLNGGLFDPINDYDWIKTDILLDNNLFSNDNPTKEGDIGDGILDIFDRYNFTVKEDEPLEKEVAIDPEMLGKVFENLLEVKDRKSKGIYYTPREIVHYMCQESLINYLLTELNSSSDGGRMDSSEVELVSRKDIEILIQYGETSIEHDALYVEKKSKDANYEGRYDTAKLPERIRKNAQLIDDKLKNIRVCDPAVGSGAFLVGMMTEIIKARNALTSHLKNRSDLTFYDFKRQAIEKSLYGVDIDLGAVEIAKLRLWLSLIVDEDNIKNIKPLPNLDYKIMQGNSLIEFITPKSLAKTTDHDRGKLIDQYNQAKQEYLSIYDPGQKKSKRDQINKLIENIMIYDKKRQIETDKTWRKYQERQQENLFGEEKIQLALGGLSEKEREKLFLQIEEFNKLKQASLQDHFEWHLNFNEVFNEKGGFDVVIANPPYVKEYVNKSAFNGLRTSDYYQGKMDLWYVFACRGLDLLKQSGVLCFIAQNNWVTSYGASKMRNKVITDTQILSLIDFADFKIFEAGIQTMVMLFKKDSIVDSYSFDYRRLQGNNLTFDNVIHLLNKEDDSGSNYLEPIINRENLKGKMLTFSNSDIESILLKIASKANFRLDPKDEVAQGIVPNPDIVNSSNIEKVPQAKRIKFSIKVGDGVFVIPKGLFVILNDYERKVLKPLYEPTDLIRYVLRNANTKEIIYSTKTINFKNIPNLLDHINRFKEIMDNRRENKNGRLEYYHLHWPRDEYFFKQGPKILAVRKCAMPTFSYTEKEVYVMMSVNIIKTSRLNLKFFTGLLNSSLISFWLRHKGKMQGNNFQIDKEPLIDLPIMAPDKKSQTVISELVDQIINTLSENSAEQVQKIVHRHESQIDQLVYKLYGLTPEEIEIIEGIKN